MKTTAITTVLTAALLVVGSLASGRPIDISAFVVLVFAASIIAWTIDQYRQHGHH